MAKLEQRSRLATRICATAAVMAVGVAVSGCADFARVTGITPIPLDTTSPVAAKVATATQTHYALPSFRDVPPKPTDIPPARSFAAKVAEDGVARDKLETWAVQNPSMQPLDPAATEAFASSGRARIPASEMVPPAPVGSEEYAARLRALATPPPPPR